MRVAIEQGPKGKKYVAYAIDWPGLERNGKSPVEALEHMATYRERYLPVANRAGLTEAFTAESTPEIVIEYDGTPSTDFWGISFGHSPIDFDPIVDEEIERHLALLGASWNFFDDVASQVSPDLRKGVRGGGRDRDEIVGHLLYAELDWLKKLDIRPELKDILPLAKRRKHHDSVVDAIRDRHLKGLPVKAKGGPPWTPRFTIRHLAFHVMDHAWEMEDKDLSVTGIKS